MGQATAADAPITPTPGPLAVRVLGGKSLGSSASSTQAAISHRSEPHPSPAEQLKDGTELPKAGAGLPLEAGRQLLQYQLDIAKRSARDAQQDVQHLVERIRSVLGDRASQVLVSGGLDMSRILADLENSATSLPQTLDQLDVERLCGGDAAVSPQAVTAMPPAPEVAPLQSAAADAEQQPASPSTTASAAELRSPGVVPVPTSVSAAQVPVATSVSAARPSATSAASPRTVSQRIAYQRGAGLLERAQQNRAREELARGSAEGPALGLMKGVFAQAASAPPAAPPQKPPPPARVSLASIMKDIPPESLLSSPFLVTRDAKAVRPAVPRPPPRAQSDPWPASQPRRQQPRAQEAPSAHGRAAHRGPQLQHRMQEAAAQRSGRWPAAAPQQAFEQESTGHSAIEAMQAMITSGGRLTPRAQLRCVPVALLLSSEQLLSSELGFKCFVRCGCVT